MGVWIEIMTVEKFIENAEVTPCVGVWIEIPYSSKPFLNPAHVTPCVGVWIEISSYSNVD